MRGWGLLKGTIQGTFKEELIEDVRTEAHETTEQLDTIGEAEEEEEMNMKAMLEALMPFLT